MELEETSKIMLPQEMFTKETSEQFLKFKEQILMQWRQILQQSVTTAVSGGGVPSLQTSTSPSSSAPPSNFIQKLFHQPQILDKFVKEHTNVVSVKPLLFAALHLRSGFPLEMLKGITLREALAKTCIPSLICTIPNRLLVKCAKSLRELSNVILQQITTETNFIRRRDIDAVVKSHRTSNTSLFLIPSRSESNTSQNMLPECTSSSTINFFLFIKKERETDIYFFCFVPEGECSYPTVNKLISVFGTELTQWKEELEQRVKKFETALNDKAQECYNHANVVSSTNNRFKASSSHFGSNHNNTTTNMSSSELMEIEFEKLSLMDIDKTHCGPLIDTATQLWVQLIEVSLISHFHTYLLSVNFSLLSE